GGCRQRHLPVPATDHDGQLLATAQRHDPLHLGEVVDAPSVDRKDYVARLKACFLGGAAWLQDVDTGGGAGLAEDHGKSCKNRDCYKEIGYRTGCHDSGACSNRLVRKALLPIGL